MDAVSRAFYAQVVNGSTQCTEMPLERERTHSDGVQRLRRWLGSSGLVRGREKLFARFRLRNVLDLGGEEVHQSPA